MENLITYSEGDEMQSEPSKWTDYIYKYSGEDAASGKTFDDLFGGSSSGYGHVKSCGINLAILVTALAGLAAMAFVLYQKITMAMVGRRRKKRELMDNLKDTTLSDLADIMLSGRTMFIKQECFFCTRMCHIERIIW
jgi:hypothetical protein